MSDTGRNIRWSLAKEDNRKEGQHGYFWPYFRYDADPEDVLWEAIQRLNLESRLRELFQVTDPLWFCFWMDSPLSVPQCSFLHDVLTELSKRSRATRESVAEMVDALAVARDKVVPLYVSMSPLGHIDLGFDTIFAHCPRCMAEAPVERWHDIDPQLEVDCAVCGQHYKPAETYSSTDMEATSKPFWRALKNRFKR